MALQALCRSWGGRPATSARLAVSVALPATRPCPQSFGADPTRSDAARLHQWAATAAAAARRRGGRPAALSGGADVSRALLLIQEHGHGQPCLGLY